MRAILLFAFTVLAFNVAVRPASAGSYPVTPNAGPWMILVQSFSGNMSAQLSEELAASLRRDYKLPSYVYNRGDEERRKERQRIAELRQKQTEYMKAQGVEFTEQDLPRIKTYRIEDQFAVLIGGWKDQETARKALDEVRKLQPPAEKYQHKATLVEAGDGGVGQIKLAGINPFRTAFVVRNPMVPAPVDPEKGKLLNLKEYNADESLSLLKCRKPYTLHVKSYQGAVVVQQASDDNASFLQKLGGGKPGQLLNASAQQAHSLAEALKMIKDAKGRPIITDNVYVLHTESCSYVTVGGFDRPDDPQLQRYQKMLANMKLGPVEQLSARPLPMPIPKP